MLFTIAALFFLAYIIERKVIYLILLVAALLNPVIASPFASEYSVVIEGALDVTTLLVLLFYGDKHKLYQISLLVFALFCHLQFELDQANITDLIFTNYATVIIGITVMQLLGAGYGICNRLFQRLWKGNSGGSLFASSHYSNRTKVWPKD